MKKNLLEFIDLTHELKPLVRFTMASNLSNSFL